jgi:hypothetical protein
MAMIPPFALLLPFAWLDSAVAAAGRERPADG